MKSRIARLGMSVSLAAVIAIVFGLTAAQPVAADDLDKIPIENYFISCEEVSIEKAWVADGTKIVRGRLLNGQVVSNEDFHTGPATNLANANVNLETMRGMFFGQLNMSPEAYPEGGWVGWFFIQGVPGDQTGVDGLRGTGSLAGYYTKSTVRHMPPDKLHELFPEACGGEMPVGGSRAEGYVYLPSDD
ncbi:MAG: hypothetical protein ABFS17_04695 [Chloroflexota bacterium]